MPQDPKLVTQQQVSFAGGLNAVQSPHNLSPQEVQASTNIDFSLQLGAASCRRGSVLYGTLSNTSSATGSLVYAMARNYGLSTGTWNDGAIPWFAATPDGQQYTGSGGSGLSLMPFSVTAGGGTSGIIPQFTQYEGYTYLGNGTNAYKISPAGNVYTWLIPQADTPVVSIQAQFNASPPFPAFPGTATGVGTVTTGTTTYMTGTYTATEGTITGTSTSSVISGQNVIMTTCTSGTGTRIVLLGGPVLTNWENPIQFITLPTGTAVTSAGGTYTLGGNIDMHQGWPNGDVTGASGTYNGTATITQTLTTGSYGTDFLLLALSNTNNVVTIQQDLSIGDATFTNYWHQETTPGSIQDATVDPVSALIESQGAQTLTLQQAALNQARTSLPRMRGGSLNNVSPVRRAASTVTISAVPAPWALARSNYTFIGALSQPTFTNIQAIRTIIEFNTPGQVAEIGGIVTYGGIGYPLNDQASGVSYYQTFARVENNVIVAEGAASNPSAPQQCQFSHATLVVQSNTNLNSGITHRVFYRSGGLLGDAYRIGSCALTAGTTTLYDYALPDMLVINNPSLRRFLWSQWPDPSAGTGLPGVNCVSAPWQQRVWVGVQNQLYWSWPGAPTQIQAQSQTTVADNGDNIQAIIPAANLVIVNQNSVYEMAGSIFEGTAQNWSLSKTMASRGCAAPRTCIVTPQGILLFGYSGISLYRQGWGIDQELSWVYEKIGDLWKGTSTTDPALAKGRIPALNLNAIFNSCAAYKDERVYLAVPTGTSTLAQTVFTLDMVHQTVSMSQYPFNICSLLWDRVANRIFAGTDQGTIMQLEEGLTDTVVVSQVGTATGVPWSFSTREWSTPTDLLLENLEAETVGSSTWSVDVDNTNTYALATINQIVKGWSPGAALGSVGDNINFLLQGTQSASAASVFSLQWDSYPQVPKVTFFQTDPQAMPSETYVKTWLADLTPILNSGTSTCTVTGSVLVDGTVVQTATFTSSYTVDSQRRKVFEVGMPNVTFGKNIYATYSCGAGSFRHYSTTFEFEPKPFGKLTWLVTYKKAGGVTQADMARFFAMDIEGQATNTLTTTWLIDGSAFTTNTLVFGATDSGEAEGFVRNYMDQIPFPPGARGYLFQQQITSTAPFMVWRASLDIDRIGIKGLSRVTINGQPDNEGRGE